MLCPDGCAHAPLIERCMSVIGCLLEHVEASEHSRDLPHADCQACLDVRSANDLLDALVPADPIGAPP